MARKKMRVLSPFLVIAIVLSLVAGVIAVSSQTALAQGDTTLTVTIDAPDPGKILPVCQNFAVTATVTNDGSEIAYNVTATITVDDSQVELAPGFPQTVDVGEISPGGWQQAGWTAHCKGPGTSTITVDATADNAPQDSDSVTVTQVSAVLVADIQSPVTSTIFSTCQDFDLVFTVTNAGEADAFGVTATIDPGATAEVDDLGAGVPFTVTIGTMPSGGTTLPITVGMHCKAPGDSTITVSPAGTDHTGEPIPQDKLQSDFVIVHQELKAHLVVEITAPGDGVTFSPCQDFDLDVIISNLGQADARDVTATVNIAGPGAASVKSGPVPAEPWYIPGNSFLPVSWVLHCDGPGDVTITVTADGYDVNSNDPVTATSLPPVIVHQEEETGEPGSRTLGFYKNHPCVVAQVLPITIAGVEVGKVTDVIQILESRKTHWDRLRSQLMATKLNVAVFGIGNCTLDDLGLEGGETVNQVIAQAEELLLADPGATKDQLSAMQDLLDRINNSNDDAPLPEGIAEACPPGKGKGKGK